MLVKSEPKETPPHHQGKKNILLYLPHDLDSGAAETVQISDFIVYSKIWLGLVPNNWLCLMLIASRPCTMIAWADPPD